MSRILSPWDAFAYFDLPTERSVSFGIGTFLVVPSNVQRVSLIIANSGPAAVVLHLTPTFPAGQGVPLAVGQSLQFNHHDDGPLTQVAWYATGAGLGNTVTYLEVVLNRWPDRTQPEQ